MRNTQFLLFFTFLILMIAGAGNVYAQDADDNYPDGYIPTPNTVTGAKPDPKKYGGKEKKIVYIITNDTKNTLAGNECFEAVTRKMGFMYMALPKGVSPNTSGFSRWMHNFGVKFVILLKNGPFWKSKVNRKYRECRLRMGDFAG